MNLERIFKRLWIDYVTQNPSAGKIYNLFLQEGEEVINDHIAFRTLDYPEINIDILAKPFLSNGYVAKGEYFFKEKHLYAKHYESSGDKNAPKIFIGERFEGPPHFYKSADSVRMFTIYSGYSEERIY